MKKSEIVVCVHGGHAVVGSRGASGYIDEVVCDRWMSDEIVKTLNKRGFKAYDISVYSGSQYEVLNELKIKAFEKGATHNISCHFNSACSDLAKGFEIWSKADSKTRYKLETLCMEYCKITKQINRGFKFGSALYVCNNLTNCILPEFCFVVNKEDSAKYNTERKCRRLARKFAKLYIKYILLRE